MKRARRHLSPIPEAAARDEPDSDHDADGPPSDADADADADDDSGCGSDSECSACDTGSECGDDAGLECDAEAFGAPNGDDDPLRGIPQAMRAVLLTIQAATDSHVAASLQQLVPAQARLEEQLQALVAQYGADDLYTLLQRRELQRVLRTVAANVDKLRSGVIQAETRTKAAMFAARWRERDAQDKRRRQAEVEHARASELRYLPTPPAPPPAALAVAGAPPPTGGSVMPPAPSAVAVAGSLQHVMVRGEQNFTTALTDAARMAHGLKQRGVDIIASDICPRCRVPLLHNSISQQMVCPTAGCMFWTRHADMTSNALPYGEEVEFFKYQYRPVSHLDDIMRNCEGGGAYIVPPDHLERVQAELLRRGVEVEDVTIGKVREIITAMKGGPKVDHAVQIHSRLTGKVPRRMSAFQKDQMRIMFTAMEIPYHKLRGGRSNNLNYPYTAFKMTVRGCSRARFHACRSLVDSGHVRACVFLCACSGARRSCWGTGRCWRRCSCCAAPRTCPTTTPSSPRSARSSTGNSYQRRPRRPPRRTRRAPAVDPPPRAGPAPRPPPVLAAPSGTPRASREMYRCTAFAHVLPHA
jgi:hypothetical protein